MIKDSKDMRKFKKVYDNSVRNPYKGSGNIGIGVCVDDDDEYMNQEHMIKIIERR